MEENMKSLAAALSTSKIGGIFIVYIFFKYF